MDPVLWDLDNHLRDAADIPSDEEIDEMADYYGEPGIDDSFCEAENEYIKRLIGDEP